MAKSRSAMLASCRSRDQGCCTRRRRAATAGCSAAIQKRKVETTSFRRERASRWSATDMAETAPNTARNWRKERFRKYTGPPVRPEAHLCIVESLPHGRGSDRSRDREGALSSRAGQFSRDASHADQVSEDDAFQGLRGGDPGIAAAAAHRHGL